MTDDARHRLGKRLKLVGLAFLGLCTVSIPVTIAFALSTTGTSDLLTIDGLAPKSAHQTPARTVASLGCAATRGYYALTFDDGPSPDATPRLVARLHEARAVATFFDVGERAAAHQDLVDLQRSVGLVANHSFSHPHMAQVSQARRLQELQTTARVLDYPNTLFRPPYGETSAAADADIRTSGLTPVYWTLDTRDAHLTAEAIVERALRVRPGGIELLHDGVQSTIDAIPGIVAGLKKRGMCPGFVATTSEAVVGANGIAFHAKAVKP